MNLQPLPIGIQTFRKIIDGDHLYVDKTRQIYDLIRYPYGVYFLARPRRFGKSLLISTLAEIFEGHRELFQGLWLYESPYQWPSHPVIRIDFSRSPVTTAVDLEESIRWHLGRIAQQHNLSLTGNLYTQQFEDLIFQLAAQKKVVILIDEYDKPILDSIENVAEAKRIRETLKRFYTVIKSMDAYIQFVFLTGISKFSKVGVFSGLNNLTDLTMDNQFSDLLGITQTELEHYFSDYLQVLAAENETKDIGALLAQIRDWYNGFCFSRKCTLVYNPFSLLLLFKMKEFSNYWFESGTPTFLIKLIRQRVFDIGQIDNLEVNELAFSSYEIDDLRVIPLLYQTGYLTIKKYDRETQFYRLHYPNYEVEHAFSHYLLTSFSQVTQDLSGGYLLRMMRALQTNNLPRFFEILNIFFANIPYDIQIKRERYYQTIFVLIFKLIGLQIEAEARTSRGRIDAVVTLADRIFLFEFKLDGSAQQALTQIKEREYLARYRGTGKPITLVGANFNSQKRGAVDWLAEEIE